MKEKRLKVLLLSLFFYVFLFPSSLFSLSSVEYAEKVKLYEHSYYKKLLHYKNNYSEVDSNNFFVSKKGKKNIKEELFETIKSLENGSNNVLCRFPLRTKWISENIKDLKIKYYDCKDLNIYINENKAKYVSLVFPNSHINSPASMYGHTFLIFTLKKNQILLSNAVNYAAQSDEKNGFLFAYNGIFGNYNGKYSMLPYYKKIKEYNNLEQRDIWEYKLDFTEEEIYKMVLHAYELKDSYSDYFFFLENCSYNVLWFLEIARENIYLVNEFSYKTIPLDSIKILKKYNLITESKYRYSKMKKMNYILKKKIKKKKDISLYIKEDNTKIFNNLDYEDKVYALDLKIEYIQYLRSKNKLSSKEYLKKYLILLKQRSKFSEKSEYNINIPKNPLLSHNSSRVSISVSTDDSYVLEIKPAYHNIYDIYDGYLQGAYIDFLSIGIKKDKDSIFLDYLNLLEIQSLSKRNELISPLSWGIKLAYNHFKNQSDYFNIKPEVGLTYGNDKNFVSFLVNTDVYYKSSNNIVSLGGKVLFVSNYFSNLKLSASYSYNRYRKEVNNNVYELFITKKISENLALNLSFQNDDLYKENKERMKLSLYYYF